MQTEKDIVIHLVVKNGTSGEIFANNSASLVNVTLPKAINNDLHTKAEKLAVYTDKKWVPNKEDLDTENIKNSPSFAKVSVSNQTVNKNLTLTIISDKSELNIASNSKNSSLNISQNV